MFVLWIHVHTHMRACQECCRRITIHCAFFSTFITVFENRFETRPITDMRVSFPLTTRGIDIRGRNRSIPLSFIPVMAFRIVGYPRDLATVSFRYRKDGMNAVFCRARCIREIEFLPSRGKFFKTRNEATRSLPLFFLFLFFFSFFSSFSFFFLTRIRSISFNNKIVSMYYISPRYPFFSALQITWR